MILLHLRHISLSLCLCLQLFGVSRCARGELAPYVIDKIHAAVDATYDDLDKIRPGPLITVEDRERER